MPAAAREDISRWFDRGVAEGNYYLVVVCDTYDWEDYPVYVGPKDDPMDIVEKHNGPNMQRVMEVYDLRLDKEMQMREQRAWHI